ncbi:MAG: hypothetical protein KDD47_24070, partial [Acidobacteria bacterium]|nr:hypothetical protein [Acidobacteriota bacterium]
VTSWDDFNGDGLADLFCHDGQGGDEWVQLSTGTALRAPAGSSGGLLKSGWCASAPVQLIDFNGDALGDLHCPADDGSQYVLVHTAPFPDLVTRITNGFEGTAELTYRPLTDDTVYSRPATSPAYPVLEVQSPLYVVSKLVQADGRGQSYGYSYRYSGARTDLERRTWLGFDTMTTVEDAGGRTVTTSYGQTFPSQGFVLDNVARTASGEILARTTQTPVVTHPYPNVYQVLPASRIQATYEAGQPALSLELQFQYDAYGNLELTSDLGDPATPDDDVFTCVRYDNDTTAWQLGYTQQEQLAKRKASCQSFLAAASPTWDSVNTLRWTQMDYDGRRNPLTMQVYDDWPAAATAPDQGTGEWARFSRTYDDYGNVLTVTDPSRGDSTLTYDTTFKTFLTTRSTPALADGKKLTTTFSYDPHFGLLTSTFDPNGNERGWKHDAFGRIVETRGPPATGSTKAATEVLTTTSFVASGGAFYDETRIRRTWDDAKPEDWYWERTYLDGLGRIYQTVSRGPSSSQNRLQTFLFDAEGQLWKTSFPYFQGATPSYTETTYDEHGRPELTTSPDGFKIKTEYHLAQKQVATIEGYGTTEARKVTHTFNARGDVLTQATPNGGATTTSYSRLSQKLTQTNPVGALTTWSYDSLGRLRVLSDVDSGRRTYRFDANGFLLSSTDGAGNLVEMGPYDAIGRLEKRKVTAADGTKEETTYTYDLPQFTNGRGRLVRESSSHYTREYAYDNYGQVATESLTLDGKSHTQTASYDPTGQIRDLTYPDGSTLRSSYD